MNILLLYYSGTFNTSFLVKKVKEEFCGEGHIVDVIDVSKNDRNIDIDDVMIAHMIEILKGRE